MKRKNYSGSDLSQEFKNFFKKEKKRLSNLFAQKGCIDFEMYYGFNFFSAFFTSPSGQVYYIHFEDYRWNKYDELLIRTAKNYTDYSGGSNQYVGTSDEEILNFKLQ